LFGFGFDGGKAVVQGNTPILLMARHYSRMKIHRIGTFSYLCGKSSRINAVSGQTPNSWDLCIIP
jgi:hypothetical protein